MDSVLPKAGPGEVKVIPYLPAGRIAIADDSPGGWPAGRDRTMQKLFQVLVRRANRKALAALADDENYAFLKAHCVFRDLSDEALLFLHGRLVERRYTRNEIIFNENAPGICLFMVKHGRVELYLESQSDQHEAERIEGTIGEGEVFGEISLVSAAFRTNSARALDQGTDLLTLSSYDLRVIEAEFPSDGMRILRAITDTICNHLVRTERRLRECREQSQRPRRRNDGNQ